MSPLSFLQIKQRVVVRHIQVLQSSKFPVIPKQILSPGSSLVEFSAPQVVCVVVCYLKHNGV